MQETQSHPWKMWWEFAQGPCHSPCCLPDKAWMFCSVHDSEAAVVMNHSVSTQAGIFTKKKRGWIQLETSQHQRRLSLQPSMQLLNIPAPSVTGVEKCWALISALSLSADYGSLRKTPLESPHEQGECVGFVCRKLQRIPLSWPPPMSCNIGRIFAHITSTINELWELPATADGYRLHLLKGNYQLHLMSS